MVGTLLAHLPEKFEKSALFFTVAKKVMLLISHFVLLLFADTAGNSLNIMVSS